MFGRLCVMIFRILPWCELNLWQLGSERFIGVKYKQLLKLLLKILVFFFFLCDSLKRTKEYLWNFQKLKKIITNKWKNINKNNTYHQYIPKT